MKSENKKHNNWQSITALAILVLGSLLMIFKMYADSEPGAIPLIMVLGGTAGFIFTKLRIRTQNSPNS